MLLRHPLGMDRAPLARAPHPTPQLLATQHFLPRRTKHSLTEQEELELEKTEENIAVLRKKAEG